MVKAEDERSAPRGIRKFKNTLNVSRHNYLEAFVIEIEEIYEKAVKDAGIPETVKTSGIAKTEETPGIPVSDADEEKALVMKQYDAYMKEVEAADKRAQEEALKRAKKEQEEYQRLKREGAERAMIMKQKQQQEWEKQQREEEQVRQQIRLHQQF